MDMDPSLTLDRRLRDPFHKGVALDKLQHALATLPETPNEIAQLLQLQGVTGHRMHASRCVLAKYLSDAVGALVTIRPNRMSRDGEWTAVAKGEGLLVLPKHIRAFVKYFDSGAFPDLVEEPCTCPTSA